MEEDAAEAAERRRAIQQAEADAEMKRASQAIQRSFELPRSINRDILRTGQVKDELQVRI